MINRDNQLTNASPENTATVTVGLASCGIAAGAQRVYETFTEVLEDLPVRLDFSGCMGICYQEPLVEIKIDGQQYIYGKVQPERVKRIVEEHLQAGNPITEWLVAADKLETQDCEFLNRQQRIR